jgi:hypothetical protein
MHNCLMDLGASHNFMPKTIMDELGLEITKDYHDLYSFDSRKVQCLGVIKDLVVTLFQLPMKSVVMDIVVVDVPPKCGMLLLRYWIKRLGETLQMDLLCRPTQTSGRGSSYRIVLYSLQAGSTLSDSLLESPFKSIHRSFSTARNFASSRVMTSNSSSVILRYPRSRNGYNYPFFSALLAPFSSRTFMSSKAQPLAPSFSNPQEARFDLSPLVLTTRDFASRMLEPLSLYLPSPRDARGQ